MNMTIVIAGTAFSSSIFCKVQMQYFIGTSHRKIDYLVKDERHHRTDVLVAQQLLQLLEYIGSNHWYHRPRFVALNQ